MEVSSLPDLEIHSDGKTVWVNNHHGLLGRLGPRGIDIHEDPSLPNHEVHCIDCGPLPPNPWEYFVKAMRKKHNVHIEDKHQPEWSKAT